MECLRGLLLLLCCVIASCAKVQKDSTSGQLKSRRNIDLSQVSSTAASAPSGTVQGSLLSKRISSKPKTTFQKISQRTKGRNASLVEGEMASEKWNPLKGCKYCPGKRTLDTAAIVAERLQKASLKVPKKKYPKVTPPPGYESVEELNAILNDFPVPPGESYQIPPKMPRWAQEKGLVPLIVTEPTVEAVYKRYYDIEAATPAYEEEKTKNEKWLEEQRALKCPTKACQRTAEGPLPTDCWMCEEHIDWEGQHGCSAECIRLTLPKPVCMPNCYAIPGGQGTYSYGGGR